MEPDYKETKEYLQMENSALKERIRSLEIDNTLLLHNHKNRYEVAHNVLSLYLKSGFGKLDLKDYIKWVNNEIQNTKK